MYLIWKVWSVAKWSQKLKGVAISLTQNPRDNRFLAMTPNVNQLSVKTFNFPEFQSLKIRWKCSMVKAPLRPNVHILVGCSCHIGGTFTILHFKVLPYWKLGKNSEKWAEEGKSTAENRTHFLKFCSCSLQIPSKVCPEVKKSKILNIWFFPLNYCPQCRILNIKCFLKMFLNFW